MPFVRPASIFVVVLLVSAPLVGQSPTSDSSSRADSQNSKPATPRRLTEAAKAAEVEGEQFLFEKHDTKSAIESFKRCILLDGWYGHGYIMLGLAYIQAQRWDDALWAFQEASKLEPENFQAWLGIGSVMNEQKDYAGAQKALQHSLDLKPDSAEAHYEMGRSLLGLQKLQEAELEARHAIRLNKDYASPHVLMANIYLAEFDADSAIGEFREALRLDPDGPDAADIKSNIAALEKVLSQPAKAPKSRHR